MLRGVSSFSAACAACAALSSRLLRDERAHKPKRACICACDDWHGSRRVCLLAESARTAESQLKDSSNLSWQRVVAKREWQRHVRPQAGGPSHISAFWSWFTPQCLACQCLHLTLPRGEPCEWATSGRATKPPKSMAPRQVSLCWETAVCSKERCPMDTSNITLDKCGSVWKSRLRKLRFKPNMPKVSVPVGIYISLSLSAAASQRSHCVRQPNSRYMWLLICEREASLLLQLTVAHALRTPRWSCLRLNLEPWGLNEP